MIWRNLIELDIITHPFFLLHCHLVVSVMYRRLAFDDDISNETKPIFEYISSKYKIIYRWKREMML